MSPTPEKKMFYERQDCKFNIPADLFKINYGYNDRSNVQVRLNTDNNTVYLCDDRESRYPDRLISAEVPFDLFIEHLPTFIQHLAAVAYEHTHKESEK